MMKRSRSLTALTMAALLASCGGGGGGSPTPTPGPIGGTPTPAPAPAPTPSSACSLSARQDWVTAQMREWYLFPETLPANPNPSAFTSVEAYLDSLTATARAQRRDRFFTFITSIQEENAFFNSGSNAGLGIRLATNTATRRVFIAEAFEGAPGLDAGIDRGTEILAIGTSEATLRPVADIIASSGEAGVSEALGPSNVGVSRVLRIQNPGQAAQVVSVTKRDYTLLPVSNRYGARIIEDGGKRVGYLNLRTFINTADPALRNAFAQFRAQGINEVIVDFRYNGGGLVSIGHLMGDLLGGNRATSEVFNVERFRPEKAQFNETRNFNPQPQSIGATKIAFIGTGATASASELVINGFIPYLRGNVGLIGTNTFGKPVGQIGLDRSQCDDRLRVVAFAGQNAAGQGDYYDGLATKVEASCQAADDTGRPLGDPQEASTRAALDYLAGRPCTRIATGQSAQSVGAGRQELLSPERPNVAQREVPGLF